MIFFIHNIINYILIQTLFIFFYKNTTTIGQLWQCITFSSIEILSVAAAVMIHMLAPHTRSGIDDSRLIPVVDHFIHLVSRVLIPVICDGFDDDTPSSVRRWAASPTARQSDAAMTLPNPGLVLTMW